MQLLPKHKIIPSKSLFFYLLFYPFKTNLLFGLRSFWRIFLFFYDFVHPFTSSFIRSTQLLFLQFHIKISSYLLMLASLQCGCSASELDLKVLLVDRLVLVLLFTETASIGEVSDLSSFIFYWPLFLCSVFKLPLHSTSSFDLSLTHLSKGIFYANIIHPDDWTFVNMKLKNIWLHFIASSFWTSMSYLYQIISIFILFKYKFTLCNINACFMDTKWVNFL